MRLSLSGACVCVFVVLCLVLRVVWFIPLACVISSGLSIVSNALQFQVSRKRESFANSHIHGNGQSRRKHSQDDPNGTHASALLLSRYVVTAFTEMYTLPSVTVSHHHRMFFFVLLTLLVHLLLVLGLFVTNRGKCKSKKTLPSKRRKSYKASSDSRVEAA